MVTKPCQWIWVATAVLTIFNCKHFLDKNHTTSEFPGQAENRGILGFQHVPGPCAEGPLSRSALELAWKGWAMSHTREAIMPPLVERLW
jgi:hypothetical protein